MTHSLAILISPVQHSLERAGIGIVRKGLKITLVGQLLNLCGHEG